jgi:RNA polymerase sigma-70 factor (ECF subfamily)
MRNEPGVTARGARAGPVGAVSTQGEPPADVAGALADKRLLAATVQGDAAAFRQLVDRHLAAAVNIARRMLNDDAEAEDAAQEAFLRLWRNALTIEVGPYGLRPWIRRVVSNLCIDRIRSGKNTSVVAEVPETSAPAPQDRDIEHRHLAARVEQALGELPERQRLALVLFHYEGMSQVEVGAVLGVSDEAVESLLARARRALRGQLKEEWQSLLPQFPDA